jgi:hypothetical protein
MCSAPIRRRNWVARSRAHLWGNLIQTLDALWTRTEFRSMVVGL